MHHAGPLPQSIDNPRTNGQVVPSKVKLGLPPSREVNPLRIGNPHNPIPNDKLLNRNTSTTHRSKILRNHPHRPNNTRDQPQHPHK